MLKPFLFRVLVKVETLESTDPVFAAAKAAGIEVARTDQLRREENAVDRGIVVSIGPIAFKEWAAEDVVNIGDEVFFAKYAGKKVKDPYTGEELLCLNDEDLVVGVYRE